MEYEDDETDEFVTVTNDGGILSLDLDGAPLGLYVPADTAPDESGMDGVKDLPDQERIWNSQDSHLDGARVEVVFRSIGYVTRL